MIKSSQTTHRETLISTLINGISVGDYPSGSRLPSVRRLAAQHGVSCSTAAEVYNALTATGCITARPGSGYYVAQQTTNPNAIDASVPADALWERRIEAPGAQIRVDAGGGWLPTDWQYLTGINAALREVARHAGQSEGYGSPNGYEPLRAHFARQLSLRGIPADPAQIVLTQGASQALDLVVRALLEPGDTVVVEDPTYPPTLELLRARGVRLLSIERRSNGPDIDGLTEILKRRRIRALFTNTTLQNPTGTSTEFDVATRLMQMARAHDFMLVEDDIFSELARSTVKPLAALDEDGRVLYVSSISKTVSPALRVGYVLAPAQMLAPVIRLKTLSALASSELSERIALSALTQPHYRRHLESLRRRLADSQLRVQSALSAHGVDLAYRPNAGMFLWGRISSKLPAGKLWRKAVDAGVLLAPGESFQPDGRASPWWRFNVAHCQDGALSRFLSTIYTEPPLA